VQCFNTQKTTATSTVTKVALLRCCPLIREKVSIMFFQKYRHELFVPFVSRTQHHMSHGELRTIVKLHEYLMLHEGWVSDTFLRVKN
jgi:hypothetical protein